MSQEQQNPFEYSGSAVVAMAGKNCVALGYDRRFAANNLTISDQFQRVFEINPKCFIALTGLPTDIQTFHQLMDFRNNLYQLREKRDISPWAFAHSVSKALYAKRTQGSYLIQPLIVGLDKDNNPLLCGMDSIGCKSFSSTYICGGTSEHQILGVAEMLYKPDLEGDELIDVCAQSLLHGVNRDTLAGWNCEVMLITPNAIRTVELKTRKD
eukprot:TRINITY_DN2487_c0_g1_i1.p1 TRINITY_DN2487_c0_g1~~TRINITY_DN2487_c0_g1_i1.p1  ORF type:complete len:220 (+),score=61.14 TRINITY_DN2487_c0_g1_i1:29-661(+)